MEHINIFEASLVNIKSLRSKSRLSKVVKSRKIICYLLHQQGLKQREIAPLVNYSRSGVKYAIQSLKVEMSVNSTLKNEINLLENQYIKKNIDKIKVNNL